MLHWWKRKPLFMNLIYKGGKQHRLPGKVPCHCRAFYQTSSLCHSLSNIFTSLPTHWNWGHGGSAKQDIRLLYEAIISIFLLTMEKIILCFGCKNWGIRTFIYHKVPSKARRFYWWKQSAHTNKAIKCKKCAPMGNTNILVSQGCNGIRHLCPTEFQYTELQN